MRWLGERLQLRSELYFTPPSSLQQATQILEQVEYSTNTQSLIHTYTQITVYRFMVYV